jgi:predicted deacylase
LQNVIKINGKEIKPGESAEHIINSYQLPSKTILEIPVFVYRSAKPGPVVLFQAGMHGDEISGIEICRQLLKKDEIKHLHKGSVIIIPVLNMISFILKSRDLPDEKDLNRCFPGSPRGSFGSRIAYDLMTEIVPQIDYGIDFHTGGAKINNYPQIRYAEDDPEAGKIAEYFAAPFTLNAPYRDKSLRKEAAKLNKSYLVYEGGESLRINKYAINEGVNGSLRLLNGLEMVSADVPTSETIKLKDSKWARAKKSGIFRTNKKYGSFIEKNEQIGIISDPFGEHEHPIIAPTDGFLIGINNQPVVNEGDALMHIGVE